VFVSRLTISRATCQPPVAQAPTCAIGIERALTAYPGAVPTDPPPPPADGAATGRGPAPARTAAPTPLDPPMVPFAVGGTVAWAVVGLVLLPFHGWLDAHGHGSWLKICLAGFLLGLVGLAVMLRHDANRRRRRAGDGPPAGA
jgi:hypothetical protein